jgi:hypothetical protein
MLAVTLEEALRSLAVFLQWWPWLALGAAAAFLVLFIQVRELRRELRELRERLGRPQPPAGPEALARPDRR